MSKIVRGTRSVLAAAAAAFAIGACVAPAAATTFLPSAAGNASNAQPQGAPGLLAGDNDRVMPIGIANEEEPPENEEEAEEQEGGLA